MNECVCVDCIRTQKRLYFQEFVSHALGSYTSDQTRHVQAQDVQRGTFALFCVTNSAKFKQRPSLSRLFKTKTASQTETKEQRVRKIKYFKKIKQHNKKKEVPRNYQSNRKVSLNEFSFPIHKIHFPSHPHSPLPLLIEICHATRFFMNPITNTILLVQVGRLSLTAK